MRFGNIQFNFKGTGVDLFLLRLKGAILSAITLGIYSFWYFKELVEFQVNNIVIIEDGKEIKVRSTLTAGQIFEMLITNYLIVIFTLGFGVGIAINRVLRVMYQNIEFEREIDVTKLVQTEDEYKNAAGDDLAGMLDISI
jgi:uncharacterized membrane protein YjgN (DUF898 family)